MIKIHALIKVLNEEAFVLNQLKTIYPFCHQISFLTQYDRDWFGKPVLPDSTLNLILGYPDPEGKIHIAIRKYNDETSAINMEMLSFNNRSYNKILTHGTPMEKIAQFHDAPDYFWYLDADEIYDVDTLPNIIDYLEKKLPRAMRVCGYNYLRSWNQRIPRDIVDFTHFGFVKSGLLFEQHRTLSWNESRISKLFKTLKLPDFSSRIYNFITCPIEVGFFHHGCWLGDNARLKSKFLKSSHLESHSNSPNSVDLLNFEYIKTEDLPRNIREGNWPKDFIDG